VGFPDRHGDGIDSLIDNDIAIMSDEYEEARVRCLLRHFGQTSIRLMWTLMNIPAE
jgi:hypothetical protein